jgi:hypothetical protein
MSKRFDPTDAINRLYSMGRTYPRGDGPPAARAKDGTFKSHSLPDRYEKPDPKQSMVQNPEDRPVSHDDVARNWLRGYGKTSQQHPHFDSGPSGSRYRKK